MGVVEQEWFHVGPRSIQNLPSALTPDDSLAGFLNKYSTSDPMEDRAEIFRFMIVQPDYINLRMKSDVILRRKVEAIRAMLGEFFA